MKLGWSWSDLAKSHIRQRLCFVGAVVLATVGALTIAALDSEPSHDLGATTLMSTAPSPESTPTASVAPDSPTESPSPSPSDPDSLFLIAVRNMHLDVSYEQVDQSGETQTCAVNPSPTSTDGAGTDDFVCIQSDSSLLSDANDLCANLKAGDKLGTGTERGQTTDEYLANDIDNDDKAVGPRDALTIRYLCPQFKPILDRVRSGHFRRSPLPSQYVDGNYEVGVDMGAGTYWTEAGVRECYWERSSRGGAILANDFVTFAPGRVTVTVHAGEGFTSNGCGVWSKRR